MLFWTLTRTWELSSNSDEPPEKKSILVQDSMKSGFFAIKILQSRFISRENLPLKIRFSTIKLWMIFCIFHHSLVFGLLSKLLH